MIDNSRNSVIAIFRTEFRQLGFNITGPVSSLNSSFIEVQVRILLQSGRLNAESFFCHSEQKLRR